MPSNSSRLKTVVPAAAFTLALAAVGLVGCAGAPNGAPSAAACVPTVAGPESDAVSKAVTGDFAKQATWDFSSAVTATTTERTVLTAGDPSKGVVGEGKTANIAYTLFNATTGEMIESSAQFSSDPLPIDYVAGTSMPGLEKTLDCASSGSRIVSVVTPDDAFGSAGYSQGDVSVGATDSIIMVIDVESVEDTPTPTPAPPADLPTPQAWDDATIPGVDMSTTPPTVTIPDAPAPTALQLKVLEAGDGAVVANPANVTIDYLGISWETKTVFDESFSGGQHASFSTSGVIPGFAAALVGQKVGSTVLVVIPPALGYPGTPDDSNPASPTGRTLVFLIQILDAQ